MPALDRIRARRDGGGSRVAAQPLAAVRMTAERTAAREPIAIIGISGRYPGAPDLDTFWTNLAAGKDCIGEVPSDRWALDGFYHADPAEAVERGMSYSKWGGFLEGFADFDPLFFKISPREAAAMDPQERLFLMTAWSTCEDAGYTRARLASRHGSRVGVFVGITKIRLCAARHPSAGGRRKHSSRHLLRQRRQSRLALSRLERPQHADRHHVLVLADGDSRGVRASAVGRLRIGAGRRRQSRTSIRPPMWN